MTPGWERGHSCLAKAMLAKGEIQPAIGELRLAIHQNPAGAAEHRVLGQTLLILHQEEEEAVRELRTAVELDPDSPLAHHFLGTALFEAQTFPAAETEFRQAVRLQPSASNHYYLVACLINLVRFDVSLA